MRTQRQAPGIDVETDFAGPLKGSELVLVDSHVHYYPCFDKSRLITSAVENFERVAARLTGTSNPVGMLIFVENHGSQEFSRFVRDSQSDKTGLWKFAPTSEKSSLTAFRNGIRRLVLLAGRQIRTAESLEVLALDCTTDIPDGKPIRETLRILYGASAIAVVPWGFGKWWARRGEIVSKLIEEEAPGHFFLGDNGGRPHLSPRPSQFRSARNRGIRILPGTDPLPLPGEEARVGSCGFVVPRPLDVDKPGASLREHLTDPATSPIPYGRGSGWLACLRSQLLLRAGNQRC